MTETTTTTSRPATGRYVVQPFEGMPGARQRFGILDTRRRLWVYGHNNQLLHYTNAGTAQRKADSFNQWAQR